MRSGCLDIRPLKVVMSVTFFCHLTVAALLVGCSTMSGSSRNVPAPVPLEVREAFERAMLEIGAENFTKAEEILSSVLGKSQQNPVPHINLAMVQLKLGKLQEAEETLKAALLIEPMNPVANNELGLLYRRTGRFEEARQVYQAILGKYPNYPAANKNLGILCDLYLRDYACAQRAYTAYATAVPDDQTARIWLTDVERRLGQ
jgi:Flp pilus assembly protein TadD